MNRVNRRYICSTIGAALGGGISGCSSIGSENEPPDIENTYIQEIERGCGSSEEDSANIKFKNSGKLIEIAGEFGAINISWELMVRTQHDNQNKENVKIRIDQFASSNSNELESDCAGIIEYEASVTLSKSPNKVTVQHIKEENDQESRTWIKTVANSSP